MGQGYLTKGWLVTEVCLIDVSVPQVIDIVHELKSLGYRADIDFTFSYHPPKFDNFSGDAVYNKFVAFAFKDEAMASWFNLKYSEYL